MKGGLAVWSWLYKGGEILAMRVNTLFSVVAVAGTYSFSFCSPESKLVSSSFSVPSEHNDSPLNVSEVFSILVNRSSSPGS